MDPYNPNRALWRSGIKSNNLNKNSNKIPSQKQFYPQQKMTKCNDERRN